MAYETSADATVRAGIAGQIHTRDDAVEAFYYSLLGAHLLLSPCFAFATWDRESFWDRAVPLGFMATTVECVRRLVEGYLGQPWLDGMNHAGYFPIVLFNFGTLAGWLWRQAKTSS